MHRSCDVVFSEVLQTPPSPLAPETWNSSGIEILFQLAFEVLRVILNFGRTIVARF